jgi:hypothetical protein
VRLSDGGGVDTLEGVSPGDTLVLRNGVECLVSKLDGDTVFASYPKQKYGRWWSASRPSITGMPEYDIIAVRPAVKDTP